jgi:acyl carrier protein
MNHLQIICEIIAKSLNRPISEIGHQANLTRDLGATSLEVLEIVMALEDTFPDCPWSLPLQQSTAQEIASFVDSSLDS